MKVLVDVNVVIDVIERRPTFFADSYAVLSLIAEGTLDGFIAAGSIADINYILRKGGLTWEQARTALAHLTQVIDMCDTTASDVNHALASGMADLEDAVLAECAKRTGADAIITRDLRDFAASPVPAMSPTQLLNSISPTIMTRLNDSSLNDQHS